MAQYERVLVTGGAGFVGSHTVDLLLERGYEVRVLDNLDPQVHGEVESPQYLDLDKVEFVKGDMVDRDTVWSVVSDVDAIIHLASRVGVGQSMYQIEQYVTANTKGTANLLDILVTEKHNVRKLVVASSMSIYGEGRYSCDRCGLVSPRLRGDKQLDEKIWELICPHCGSVLKPEQTDEEKPLQPTSIYAMTKRHQAEMSLLIGRTYGIPTTALRYFNIYGPRQALSNPYTGVIAVFAARTQNNNPPLIFEDGNQTRDFIHVKDVARANLLAMEKSGGDYQALNVGTGKATSIREIALKVIELCEKELTPLITGRYRSGDIRHCFASIERISSLEFKPEYSLDKGLRETLTWVRAQKTSTDRSDEAVKELEEHGLLK
jgi:dTDP-L-rhamnose 4-epimerase